VYTQQCTASALRSRKLTESVEDRVYLATTPLDVPAPLVPLVNFAAALPVFGAFVCHYMVILEIRERILQESPRAEEGGEKEGGDKEAGGRVVTSFILCDFEPLHKTSPAVTYRLLTAGRIFGIYKYVCIYTATPSLALPLMCIYTHIHIYIHIYVLTAGRTFG